MRLLSALGVVFSISVLVSCGGGGGGGGGAVADTISITKTSPVSQTSSFVEGGSDPLVSANVITGSPSTTIGLCSGVVDTSCTNRSIYINIKAVAQKDGSYAVVSNASGSNEAWIYYTESSISYFSVSGGTVNITRMDGTAGGRIQGSFSGVTLYTGSGTNSIIMNGMFDVTIDSVL